MGGRRSTTSDSRLPVCLLGGALWLSCASVGIARAEPGPEAALSSEADWRRCQQIGSARERLTCFDQAASRWLPPITEAVAFPTPAGTEQARSEPPSAPEPAQAIGLLSRRGIWSTVWELDPADKHGTFNFKTYRPNFVLPLHVSSRINDAPSTPTRGTPSDLPSYQPFEVKLQLSLRTKVIQDVGFPDGDVWFAYTQQSQWQLWNRRASAPFRNTDHEPEVVYVVPVRGRWQSVLPWGWEWKMAQAGFAHQSNGQSGGLSRSWNRVYLGAAAERGPWSLQARWHRRLKEDPTNDDNPDLTRYIGQGDLTLGWVPGRATAQLVWRPTFGQLERGSWTLSGTYPVRAEQPQGLRWYGQLFTGYGESLLDYNVRQTSLGLGVSLFEF